MRSFVGDGGTRVARGRVKWFNDASGYGFIVPDDAGSDLYVPGGNLVGTTLTAGDRVEFDARVAGMGPEAINVRPLPPNTTQE